MPRVVKSVETEWNGGCWRLAVARRGVELSGYGVSLLQGEEGSTDWLCSNVNALNCTRKSGKLYVMCILLQLTQAFEMSVKSVWLFWQTCISSWRYHVWEPAGLALLSRELTLCSQCEGVYIIPEKADCGSWRKRWASVGGIVSRAQGNRNEWTVFSYWGHGHGLSVEVTDLTRADCVH